MSSLNKTVTANVKIAIKRAGSPSFYRLGREMAEVMVRPPGVGLKKYGPQMRAETCRKTIEQCIAGRQCWRLDYLEALAWVLDVKVAELVSPPRLDRK